MEGGTDVYHLVGAREPQQEGKGIEPLALKRPHHASPNLGFNDGHKGRHQRRSLAGTPLDDQPTKGWCLRANRSQRPVLWGLPVCVYKGGAHTGWATHAG